jgi:HEAT repeat protein
LLDFLFGMTDDPSQDVRAEAMRALGHFAVLAAGGELEDETGERIFDSLLRMASSDEEPQLVRRYALESLASFGGRKPIPDLIRSAYDDEDQSVRAGALFAMGRTLDPRWLNVLMSELTAEDPELR